MGMGQEHSEKVFHNVETFFPLCGKIVKHFSIVWKNRPDFSTVWKTFFHSVEKLEGASCIAGILAEATGRGKGRNGRDGAASLPVLADEVEEGFAVLGELLGADAVDVGE
jgi:hypothetical protein